MDTSDDLNLDAREVYRAMETALGFKGERRVLEEIYSTIDCDDSGVVGIDDFNAWVHQRETKKMIAQHNAERVSFHAATAAAKDDQEQWDVDRLRWELTNIMQTNGVEPADLLKTWDKSGDGQISRKEMLMEMKALVNDYEVWYSTIRRSVKESFDVMNTDEADTKEATISILEFAKWLNVKIAPARLHKIVRRFSIMPPQQVLLLKRADELKRQMVLAEERAQGARQALSEFEATPPKTTRSGAGSTRMSVTCRATTSSRERHMRADRMR